MNYLKTLASPGRASTALVCLDDGSESVTTVSFYNSWELKNLPHPSYKKQSQMSWFL